jgi:hypothetical protein
MLQLKPFLVLIWRFPSDSYACRDLDLSIAMPQRADHDLATSVAKAPAGDDWLPGYIAMAKIESGKVRMLTRRGLTGPRASSRSSMRWRAQSEHCLPTSTARPRWWARMAIQGSLPGAPTEPAIALDPMFAE